MSPEMANGEATGTATDVFAIGIVFAILLRQSPCWNHFRVLREYSWGQYQISKSCLHDISSRLR